jgi:divalent metal cation (Fe/Co/Zn/Cd) transporter
MERAIHESQDGLSAGHHGRLPQVRTRWIGHRLYAQADSAIDARLSVGEGIELARRFELAVTSHLPEIRAVHVGIRAAEESSA